MDNNWIVENLTNAFTTWNSKMTEMWSLLTESPQTFKGGTIWQTIVAINGGMQAIGYGLLVLFFAIGIFRSSASFREFQRPEQVLRHFIYFVLAKLGITYGMDLLVNVFDVCNGIVATAAGSVGGLTGASVALPQEIADAIGDVGFLASIPLWLVTLLGSLMITVLAFIMILTVYGRFLRFICTLHSRLWHWHHSPVRAHPILARRSCGAMWAYAWKARSLCWPALSFQRFPPAARRL